MSLRQKKIVVFSIWLLTISCAPVTIIKNTSIEYVLTNPLTLVNAFQRFSGMMAYLLLSMQIILGSQMNFWIKFLGASAYRIHTTQGLITYGFILVHPLFQNIIVYQLSKNALKAFLEFFPNFQTQMDLLIVYGKIGFLLAFLSFFAAYFRTKPFFRKNWRLFHALNYLIFYLIFLHSKVGSDVQTVPFSFVRIIALIFVSFTLLLRFYPFVLSYFRKSFLPNHSK